IRKSNTGPIRVREDSSEQNQLVSVSTEHLQACPIRPDGNRDRRQSKSALSCFSLCHRLRKRYSKSERATGHDHGSARPTADWQTSKEPTHVTVVREPLPAPLKENSGQQPKPVLKGITKQIKPAVSSETQISTLTDSHRKNRSKPSGDMPETTSMTSDISTPRSRNTIETNDADNSMDSQIGLLSSVKNLQTTKGDGCFERVNVNDEKGLRYAVEHCERRLERLYGRLIWLRNTESLTITTSTPSTIVSKSNRVKSAVNEEKIKEPVDKESTVDMCLMQKQLKSLSMRVRDLNCQVETFSFLSWIGLIQEPNTNQMSVPGIRAPPANPKLYLTRRPDSDARETAREYKRLCEHPISDPVRLDLRRATFNNWPWSDSWLIRFVRQMFVDLGFVEEFALPMKRLDLWLCDIYRRYNRVPFHNYKHAFMVTQMCYALLWGAKLTESLTKEDQLTLLVSAICHDLDHPGFNNAYQINAGTELAMRYNDQSPLENHHCATAFDILSHCEANPFEHLDFDTMKKIREGVIRCILATDMSRHNEIMSQFSSVVLSDLDSAWEIDEETKQPLWATEKTKRDLVMMILIKVCDISNEARPLTVAGPWIDRLLAEFFHQSDYEKLVGLPVAPFMDREKVTKSASQCGFIRFVILPLFESLAKLLPPVKALLVQPALEQLSYYTEMQIIDEQQESQKAEEKMDDVPTNQPEETS
ncbi:unnamed protein product, partial [Echinostoma caproni]|uniref:Phosphodiesterase n=1 Tax=Echinostoma caproni TaxID=27848 RepID=A0A183AAG8_9TREM